MEGRRRLKGWARTVSFVGKTISGTSLVNSIVSAPGSDSIVCSLENWKRLGRCVRSRFTPLCNVYFNVAAIDYWLLWIVVVVMNLPVGTSRISFIVSFPVYLIILKISNSGKTNHMVKISTSYLFLLKNKERRFTGRCVFCKFSLINSSTTI